MTMRKNTIAIQWTDFDGSEAVVQLRSEFDAVLFEESLDAQGLAHNRKGI